METAWRYLSDLTVLRGDTVQYSLNINIAARLLAQGNVSNMITQFYAGYYLPGNQSFIGSQYNRDGVLYDHLLSVEDFYGGIQVGYSVIMHLSSGNVQTGYETCSAATLRDTFGSPKIINILVIALQLSTAPPAGNCDITDLVVDVKDALIVTNMIQV